MLSLVLAIERLKCFIYTYFQEPPKLFGNRFRYHALVIQT